MVQWGTKALYPLFIISRVQGCGNTGWHRRQTTQPRLQLYAECRQRCLYCYIFNRIWVVTSCFDRKGVQQVSVCESIVPNASVRQCGVHSQQLYASEAGVSEALCEILGTYWCEYWDSFCWVLILLIGRRETQGGAYARYTRFVWIHMSKTILLTFWNQVLLKLPWLKTQNWTRFTKSFMISTIKKVWMLLGFICKWSYQQVIPKTDQCEQVWNCSSQVQAWQVGSISSSRICETIWVQLVSMDGTWFSCNDKEKCKCHISSKA